MHADTLGINICAAALALLILGAKGSAVAQTSQAAIDQAREPFGQRTPSLVYAVDAHSEWEVVSIFAQPFEFVLGADPNAPAVWIARRATAGEAGEVAISWADSRSCQAIEGVIWSLTRISPPQWEVPGLTRPRPKAGVAPSLLSAHPVRVRIWGQGGVETGQFARVSVDALGGDLGEWATFSAEALADCWSPTTPSE